MVARECAREHAQQKFALRCLTASLLLAVPTATPSRAAAASAIWQAPNATTAAL
jgi:hypothetical protein